MEKTHNIFPQKNPKLASLSGKPVIPSSLQENQKPVSPSGNPEIPFFLRNTRNQPLPQETQKFPSPSGKPQNVFSLGKTSNSFFPSRNTLFPQKKQKPASPSGKPVSFLFPPEIPFSRRKPVISFSLRKTRNGHLPQKKKNNNSLFSPEIPFSLRNRPLPQAGDPPHSPPLSPSRGTPRRLEPTRALLGLRDATRGNTRQRDVTPGLERGGGGGAGKQTPGTFLSAPTALPWVRPDPEVMRHWAAPARSAPSDWSAGPGGRIHAGRAEVGPSASRAE